MLQVGAPSQQQYSTPTAEEQRQQRERNGCESPKAATAATAVGHRLVSPVSAARADSSPVTLVPPKVLRMVQVGAVESGEWSSNREPPQPRRRQEQQRQERQRR